MSIAKIFQEKKVVFSLEVFPPKETSSVDTIYNTLYDLRHLPADFISVTYGAGGSAQQKDKTCEISALIQKEYGITSLSHLTCVNSTKTDIVEVLEKLKQNGVYNILALRGDKNPEVNLPSDFAHASDLIAFIKEYDQKFHLSGSCYPEGHPESASLEADIATLPIKIAAGAEHLISQLFFDNNCFYHFMDLALAAGVSVPVDAGIMPITNKVQIDKVVALSGASLPTDFVNMIEKYGDNKEDMKKAGLEYATKQIVDLLEHGVQGIHLYTMNNTEVATCIYHDIKSYL